MSENVKTNESVSGIDAIEELFSDYEKKKTEDKKSGGGRNDFSKYFKPTNDIETFRLVPPVNGRKLIEDAYFHYLQVNTASGKKVGKRVYCLSKNNPKVPKKDINGNVITDEQGNPVMVKERCPACEKVEKLRNSIPEDIRYKKNTELDEETRDKRTQINKKANEIEAKLYHIVRGIDRGSTKDGVKFWRFKDNHKKQGVYDKLIPAMKLFVQEYKSNPSDPINGCDFHITVVESSFGGNNTRKYKDVAAITAKKPSRLHDDDVLMNEWLKDKTIWRDVYKPAAPAKLSPLQYLERVIKGTDPYWDDSDQENKKYVFPDPSDAHLQEEANKRSQSLDSSDDDEEMASDLVGETANVIAGSYETTIENVQKEDVGTYTDNSIDVTKEFREEEKSKPVQSTEFDDSKSTDESDDDFDGSDDDFDDLPF